MWDAEELEQLHNLLDTMDGREAAVLRICFGLGGAELKTLKEIGEHFGLTRERIRQIENEALAKLGDRIEES